MRIRVRNDYGDPTPAGRRVGIAIGLLSLVALGFALGRMASPAPAVVSAPASATPSVSAAPAAPSRGPAPNTPMGAITAAARADCILGGPLVSQPARYQVALAAILAPDKAGAAAAIAHQESAQLDQQTGLVSAAAQGTKTYVTCVPLGYRVESYAPATASVSVWTEQIVAVEGRVAPTSSYVTETLHLVWTGGAWKLESSELLDTQWAPAPRQTALAQSTTLPAQLVNFTAFEGA